MKKGYDDDEESYEIYLKMLALPINIGGITKQDLKEIYPTDEIRQMAKKSPGN